METEILNVTEANVLINQTLEFAYPELVVEGEVSSYKLNQGKWVFFDIKDETSSLACFMPIYQLKTTLEDGMLVRVHCSPKLTQWGKFSLTVKAIELSGAGSVKKAFELLKAQFEREGLFAQERKRTLPRFPRRVALITSAQAAAYNDFVSILGQRFHALEIDHLQVQVQGIDAVDQLVRAVEYCSARDKQYDVVVIIRGGGSLEDLQAFNAEPVVRAIFGCSIPTLVGIGSEDDVSLSELVADMRAATPTDAARRLVPELDTIVAEIDQSVGYIFQQLLLQLSQGSQLMIKFEHSLQHKLNNVADALTTLEQRSLLAIQRRWQYTSAQLQGIERALKSLNPHAVMARGYSIATIDGVVVKNAKQVLPNSHVMLQLHQGKVDLMPNIKRLSHQSKQSSHGQNHQTSLSI